MVECVIRAKRGKERERRRRKEKRKEKGRVTRRGQRSNMIEIVVMVMRMRIYKKGLLKGSLQIIFNTDNVDFRIIFNSIIMFFSICNLPS